MALRTIAAKRAYRIVALRFDPLAGAHEVIGIVDRVASHCGAIPDMAQAGEIRCTVFSRYRYGT
jgi:hypothetical protein